MYTKMKSKNSIGKNQQNDYKQAIAYSKMKAKQPGCKKYYS